MAPADARPDTASERNVRSKNAPAPPPSKLFVKAVAPEEVTAVQRKTIRSIKNAALALEKTMKDKDGQEQLLLYDSLYQDRVTYHGDWIKKHLILEEIVDYRLRHLLDEMSGLSQTVDPRQHTVVYSFRGIVIDTKSLALIRDLPLPKRVLAGDAFVTTSEEVSQDPDL